MSDQSREEKASGEYLKAFELKLQSDDIDDIYDALIDIGKGGFKQYKSEVTKFLTHKELDARRAAVMVLGTYWKEKDFIGQAKFIAEHDEDPLVRSTALMAWFFYFENTNNHEVLTELFEKVKQSLEKPLFRAEAFRGIYVVSGNEVNAKTLRKLEFAEDDNEFNQTVPWDELQTIVSHSISKQPQS
jgi:hypothetical protein